MLSRTASSSSFRNRLKDELLRAGCLKLRRGHAQVTRLGVMLALVGAAALALLLLSFDTPELSAAPSATRPATSLPADTPPAPVDKITGSNGEGMLRQRMLHLLVFSQRIPLYDSRGSDLRMLNMLHALRESHTQITFVPRYTLRAVKPYHRRRLTRLGIRVVEWEDHEQLLEGESFDMVMFHLWYWRYPEPTVYRQAIDKVKATQRFAQVVVVTDDVHWAREAMIATLEQLTATGTNVEWSDVHSVVASLDSVRDAEAQKRISSIRVDEIVTYAQADLVMSVTFDDRSRLSELCHVPFSKTGVLPYWDAATGTVFERDYATTEKLVYVGGPNAVNSLSVRWFLDRVLPRIRATRGMKDVEVQIIGKVCTLLRNSQVPIPSGVHLLDYVKDVDEMLMSARVFIAPVVAGTGINTKNVLALSHGVPLVTTTIGSEGLGITPANSKGSSGVWVSDSESGFASAVATLYTDKRVWRTAHLAGPQHVTAHLNWDKLLFATRGMLERVRQQRAQAMEEEHVADVPSVAVAAGRAQTTREAYATLLLNEGYLEGACVLAQSLRDSGTEREIVVVTVLRSNKLVARLMEVFDRIVFVDRLPNPMREEKLQAKLGMSPEDLAQWRSQYPERYQYDLFTKLHLFNLVDYSKVVYLDSDILVMENIDDLFERPALAAAPDMMPPDNFNSGLMVIEPSKALFDDLVKKSHELPAFNGGDQGFLNAYFKDWFTMSAEHRIPLDYNWMTKIQRMFRPLWFLRRHKAKAIHFSPEKPWRDLPWKDVDGEVKMGERERKRQENVREYNLAWWHHWGNIGSDQHRHELVGVLPSGLRLGLHAQTLQRPDGKVSGSEITTLHLRHAAEADPRISFVRRYGPEERNRETLDDDHLDLFIIEGYHDSLPKLISRLRAKHPGIVILFWCLSISSSYIHRLGVDGFMSNSRIMKRRLSRFKPTVYLPLAGDPTSCTSPVSAKRTVDVSYIAAFSKEKSAVTRQLLVGEAADHPKARLELYGVHWDEADEKYKRHWQGKYKGDVSTMYEQSVACLSVTRESQKRLGMINNRPFDAMSCGCQVIMDWFPSAEQFFGDHVFYAKSPGDTTKALDEIAAQTPEERKEAIAKAVNFVQQHTYRHRFGSILEFYGQLVAAKREASKKSEDE